LPVTKRAPLQYPVPQPATSRCHYQNEHPSSIQFNSQRQPHLASHKTNAPPVSSPQAATSCCQSQNEHSSSIQFHSQQPHIVSQTTSTPPVSSTTASNLMLPVRKRAILDYPVPQPAATYCLSQNEHPSSFQSHSQQLRVANHKTTTPPVSSPTASNLMLPVTKRAPLQYLVPQPAATHCQSDNEHPSSIQYHSQQPHVASHKTNTPRVSIPTASNLMLPVTKRAPLQYPVPQPVAITKNTSSSTPMQPCRNF
jgi:hypothetical protein